jgi:hypothetical protein
MPRLRPCIVLLALCAALGLAALAQDRAGVNGVVNVIGLEGVPRDAKGTLIVDDTAVRFLSSSGRADIPLAWVQDVVTGDDSQRAVRGTLQALSMLAPYGGGRFLSLFRTKIDLLTIEYRDDSGGLHGVVFTLPDGKAFVVKQQMVERGARTTVPLVEELMKKDEKKEPKEEKKP